MLIKLRERFWSVLRVAYRRPATATEIERLAKLSALPREQGETFEEGIRLGMQAVLASPHFLYKVELDPGPQDNGVRQLSDFELATRLSYFLWNSMPDDELFLHACAARYGKTEISPRRFAAY